MNYWVVAADGNKYGPADAATLAQWAAENRLQPDSDLEVVETGQRVKAEDVPGIVFPTPQAVPANDPIVIESPKPAPTSTYTNYDNPYPRASQPSNYISPDAAKNLRSAYIGAIFGFFCCPIALVISPIYAVKAKNEGHPGGQTALIVSIVLIVVWILLLILRFAVLGERLPTMGGA